jgi:hypothetical protein
MALIAAVAFSQPHVSWYNLQIETEESMVAAALMFAALFKSSQLPLTSLFVRSMEGPTPASALGYAVRKWWNVLTVLLKKKKGFVCACGSCFVVVDDAIVDGV